jgi:hypothetical protein
VPRSLLAVGSWLAPPPLMGGGIASWDYVLGNASNALIRSSLNRQLCELPAASHAAVHQCSVLSDSVAASGVHERVFCVGSLRVDT